MGLYRNGCEPCGGCAFCRRAQRYNKDVGRLRRLLNHARSCISDELMSAGPKDTAEHPVLRAHARILRQIEKELQ